MPRAQSQTRALIQNGARELGDVAASIFRPEPRARHTELDLNKPILAIMGSEEEGIREKTLEKCSQACTLSKNKTINSLNVSVAAGVILFEIARQKLA